MSCSCILQSNAGRPLKKKQVVHWLLEDDVARQFQDTNDDDDNDGKTICLPSSLFATNRRDFHKTLVLGSLLLLISAHQPFRRLGRAAVNDLNPCSLIVWFEA